MTNENNGVLPPQTYTLPNMAEQNTRQSAPTPQPSMFIHQGAQLLFAISLVASGIFAWAKQDFIVFLNLSFAFLICYSGFIGWYNGLLRELAVLTSLIAPPIVGYFEARNLALYFGHTSWLAILGGFWACVLVSFLIIRITMFLFRSLLWPASFFGRVGGLALGLSEAILLFVVIGNIYQTVPFADQELGQYMKTVTDYFGDKLTTPGLQIAAASAREVTDITLQIKKNGFDPSKVDQETLRRNFEPIVNNPSIQELANDQALMEKLKAGKSFEVLASPKIRELLGDPELASAASLINWTEVLHAVRQGIPPTPLAGSPTPEPAQTPTPSPGEAPAHGP